ncbi:ELL-associated factor 1-like [Hydractinia symbiolongicarpus]|uniref:ELL-associated factor 1-like n=1 Tax=Hydractinia symbiolongicarpus TaxID=13093 RepID=UPI00254DEA7C|nr:ELL-associated factor 1-like [Hydractinia symbiolongicarpus]
MSSLNHGLVDGKEYPMKIGSSFQAARRPTESYHTIRYDFKPASIDTNRPVEFRIGSNNECTVDIPNKDSGTMTYKGGKKPCTKECILIIDKDTGEITLERLSSNIPLKKSRSNRSAEVKKPSLPLPSKHPTKANASSSNTSSHTTPITTTSSSTPSGNKQFPPSSSTSTTQQKSNNNSPAKTNVQSTSYSNIPGVKARDMSTTSTSDSSSSESDSDSTTEENNAVHEDPFSTKSYEPPPPPQSAAKPPQHTTESLPTRPFGSTLDDDLRLSDSSDSD